MQQHVPTVCNTCLCAARDDHLISTLLHLPVFCCYGLVCVRFCHCVECLHVQVDEYLADKPELRRQIDNDIKNHHWY